MEKIVRAQRQPDHSKYGGTVPEHCVYINVTSTWKHILWILYVVQVTRIDSTTFNVGIEQYQNRHLYLTYGSHFVTTTANWKQNSKRH